MTSAESLWSGNLIAEQLDVETQKQCIEIRVTFSFLAKSRRNQSTFNWGTETTAVQLKRFPKKFLKTRDEDRKKINLNKYLKNSQVVCLCWEVGARMDLVNFLGGNDKEKFIGYLKPDREDLTPVVLVVTEVSSEIKVVGFCVDVVLNEVQHSRSPLENVFLFRTFHNLLMGSAEQEQGKEKRKFKKTKVEEDENKEETIIHVSTDSKFGSSVKLETEGQELGARMIHNYDIFKREIEKQDYPRENECNNLDRQLNKWPRLDESDPEDQCPSHHPGIGGQLLDIVAQRTVTGAPESEIRTSGCRNSSDSDDHQNLVNGKDYKCNQCDYQASLKHHLVRHQKSIHEKEKFKCNKCDYHASHKYGLARHHKSKHSALIFTCNQCDYQASRKVYLVSHQKTVHEGIRYNCSQCDYQSKWKSRLKYHQKSDHNIY